MILPIGDQPNPRGVPWVNYGLLALNVAVFLLVSLPLMGRPPDVDDPATIDLLRRLAEQNPHIPMEALVRGLLHRLTAYDLFLGEWGYRPGAPSALTVLTSMFLHGGWLHLIGNMLFLWIYGDNVEARLGHVPYLIAYLATGAVAAVGYGAFVPASAGGVPMVGASGAISGVLGFYFLWFPRNKVRLLVLLFPFFFDVVLVGARLVLGFYLVIENLLPYLLSSAEGGGVAHGAHIGGFVGGLAGAWLLDALGDRRGAHRARKLPDADEADAEDAPAGAPTPRGPTPAHSQAAAVEDAVDGGRPATAVRRYLALDPAARREVPLATVLHLAQWLARDRQPDAALALYRRALADHPSHPDVGRLLLGIGRTLLDGMDRPAGAYPYLLDVLDVNPPPDVEAAARQALAEIARRQKHPVRPYRRKPRE